MLKRILFIFPTFGIGGTVVSTINLISLLKKEGYECWVMPLCPSHGIMVNHFANVHQIKTPFTIHALAIGSWKYEHSIIKKTCFALIRFLRNHSSQFEKTIVGKTLDTIIQKYHFDTVIACQENITTRFVSYARTKDKVTWMRCDYKRFLEDTGRKRDIYYQNYKAIVCVSNHTYLNFKEIYPEYAHKTYCIPNPQDENLIKEQAYDEDIDHRFKKQGKTLMSIGRLDAIKRFDQIASIAKKLKGNGLEFRWFLIGDGIEWQNIEKSIHENNVEDCVIMLGAKPNPYFYLKRADLLVCLSRSEACPRVINEAKILHIPTVSTDFPSIHEFIKDGETGLISTLPHISNTILKLMVEEKLYVQIKRKISMFHFENSKLLKQIKNIIDS